MCFVLASEVLRNCVRDLTFDTRLFVPIGLAVERYGSRGLPKQVDYAMYHCHSFANLTSGSVRFERLSHRRFHPSPPYCSDYHAREMGLYRSNMISLLLATLMYRDPTSTHLRKISIENLQIWPETYLAKRAADFESLCSRLETLKLRIVSGEASDDWDYRSSEIQRTEFFEQLGLFSLRPTMRFLSTLSLYGDNGWGTGPTHPSRLARTSFSTLARTYLGSIFIQSRLATGVASKSCCHTETP